MASSPASSPDGYATEHFHWSELTCKCGCGTRYISATALAALEAMRVDVGKPFIITSAARCPRHNAREGGAPMSMHRSTKERPSTAFDIALGGHDKERLIEAAKAAGFNGLGTSYKTFLHVDMRKRSARW